MSGAPEKSFDSKDVDKALRRILWTELGALGFDRRTGRTTWRDRPDCVQTVNVQSFNRYLADAIGCTTFSFAVNLGVFYPTVADNTPHGRLVKDGSRPAEYHCQARYHMAKGIAQPDPEPDRLPAQHLDPGLTPIRWRDRPDVWYVTTDGSNLVAVVADARDQVVRVGLPWLEQLADPREARRRFVEAPSTSHAPGIVAEGFEGAIGSPARGWAIEALTELIEGRHAP